MRRTVFCEGGPLDGRTHAVLHGRKLIHAPTGTIYEPAGRQSLGIEIWVMTGVREASTRLSGARPTMALVDEVHGPAWRPK